MAEMPPKRPFVVVSDILYDIKLVDYPSHWVKVKFLKREAYGCGKNGDLIVEGLDLHVRAGPDDDEDFHPALCIGASRGVLNCIGWQIDKEIAEIYGRQVRVTGSVCTKAGDVLVLRVSFIARHDSSYFRSYYLVYDSTAAALFLLPHDVPDCEPICSPFPLRYGQGNCSLFLMADRETCGKSYPVFLKWSQPPVLPEPARKFKVDKHGWVEKIRLPDDSLSVIPGDRDFTPSVVLLHNCHVLWCDLGLGIMSYNCRDLICEREHVGKFRFLPSSCKTSYHFDEPPLEVYRNMGCLGSYVWFVTIEPAKEEECPGETMVSLWRILGLPHQEGDWELYSEFKMKTIWELDDFRTKEMPKTVPKFPFVNYEDYWAVVTGDDAMIILYMLLPEPYKGEGGSYARLVGIGLSGSCPGMRLLVDRRLVIPWMERPVVLDPYFFNVTA